MSVGVRAAESGAEIVVCGGGLAGAAAAITLAQGGRRVALLERSAHAHDKVCGEFLSGESLDALKELGVEAASLGAIPIRAVCLAGRLGARTARLPFPAMALTRRVLDEALLERAAEVGVEVLRGRTVRGLENVDGGWAIELDAPGARERLQARAAFLATGKHDLRGYPRPHGGHGDLVAFKMYLQLSPEQASALEGRVELVLYRGGYGGLMLVEDGSANLSCLVSKRKLRRLDGGWPTLLESMLRDSWWLRRRLQGAEPLRDRPLAIGSLPYGFVRRTALGDGLWAVGDQAAVMPSFTGDGMSLALRSGRLAARMYQEGASSEEYQRKLHAQLRGKISAETVLSRMLASSAGGAALQMGTMILPRAMRWVASGTRLGKTG